MIERVLLTVAALSSMAVSAPVKSGQATAEWVNGTTAYQPGESFRTGIRLVVNEGWHTYWSNPGEAGSKLRITWTLPEGWTASEPSYPVPISFLTGELPGYGYEHEVIFPVTITPPAGATGSAELKAKVSWLTCNDDSCVPGKAELSLAVTKGTPAATPETGKIAKFEALVPQPLPGAELTVKEEGSQLRLFLKLPAGATTDPSAGEVFPATAQAVDHSKPFRFEKTDDGWSATATKNEYAAGPLKELALVISNPQGTPLTVVWKAN